LNHLRYIFLVIVLLLGLLAKAQFKTSSNYISKKITTKGVIQLESTKKIVPNTIRIVDVDAKYYSVDYTTASIKWLIKPDVDSVLIQYRVFAFAFSSIAKRLNYDSVKNNFIAQPFIFNRNNTTKNASGFFGAGAGNNMNYNGSFGRSLSFGNNQDAVFNSQLNLQISGMLGDSIELAAAITDNNIPIQPDGTTQQLNEFDKILLQFKKHNWQINMGDIDLRQSQYYFLNFYKRLQGVSYEKQNVKATNKFLVAGAIAKGKFVRNVFQGQEGNQGPYRLQGNNNEFYLIILSGTEKVFIDGEMLQRGEDQDYTINYNTGEIVFTPKRMITKDKRIQVEFEYADRNYLNSILFASNELQVNKKLKIGIAAYSNVDAKNSTINQSLDNNQKQFLANLGDSVQNAFYKTASRDTFSASKILYAKRVNPVNVLWDSIYVYSVHPDSAKFSLSFIDVGINKGDYIPLFNGANGKVYQYITPVNGIKQGNYEAAVFLVTPKKQQLITVNAVYSINKQTILQTNVALNNYDINTFSSKDKANNNGLAAKFLLQHAGKVKRDVQLLSTIGYEWVDEKFRTIERLRSVEFARDWGLPILTQFANEHLPKLGLELKNTKTNTFLKYSLDGYLRSDNFTAVRNSISYNAVKGFLGVDYNTSLSVVQNRIPTGKGNYIKANADIGKTFAKLNNYQIGFTYLLEHNQQKYTITDTVTPISFAFENIGGYIKSDVTKNNKWSFNYFSRTDKLPYQKSLLATDKSNNYNFLFELLQNAKHQFRFNITYRELMVKNSFLTNLTSDKSLLGRTEYIINEFNGFITGNTLYEVGAGQEQRRDFSYIEVPAGRGEYAWNDYNADGIPQLNEFEIALFPDQAKYIRVFTPTNQFVKANYTQFNYNINISPRALSNYIKNKKIKSLVTRFNIQSAMQTGKKILADGKLNFNPFKGNIADTALISLNNIFSNTISFNRFSSSWGMDISNLRNYNKALLTYGFESREIVEWIFRTRVNIRKQFTLEVTQKLGSNNLATPKFGNRNYGLTTFSTEPKLTYTYLTQYRLQASYMYASKENSIIYGGQKSINNALNIEGKLNTVNSTSFLVKFTYNNIQYDGLPNSTVSYIMLDGLLPGKNLLWNVELTKRLGNNLELTLNYEGRKPGETRVINIGRASLRALL
jgi:hypothetical protein